MGYARTSTQEQIAGLEAQVRDLTAFGCTEIFRENVSAVAKREELQKALRFIRKGDQLVCVSLSRLARSVPDLIKILEEIDQREASLTIMDMHLDTATPSGRLMMNLCGSIAQFEREIMLQRQREGISAAKAQGKYKGRAPTALAKSADVIALHGEGVAAAEIALRLGISRASVYRIIASQKQKPDMAA